MKPAAHGVHFISVVMFVAISVFYTAFWKIWKDEHLKNMKRLNEVCFITSCHVNEKLLIVAFSCNHL